MSFSHATTNLADDYSSSGRTAASGGGDDGGEVVATVDEEGNCQLTIERAVETEAWNVFVGKTCA